MGRLWRLTGQLVGPREGWVVFKEVQGLSEQKEKLE